MSNQSISHSLPEGRRDPRLAVPASLLGLAAGLGLWLCLPGQARADHDGISGHAEITLGFPHAQVTLGNVWDTGPREVVVEQVRPDYDDEAVVDDEDEDADRVVIEKRPCHRHHHVTVVERYGDDPDYYDRVHVVRRDYADRACGRDAVVYRAPERVIYAPSRVVVEGRGHADYRGPDGGEDRGSYHGENHGPRNLFPQDGGRPSRARGVQHSASAGGRSR